MNFYRKTIYLTVIFTVISFFSFSQRKVIAAKKDFQPQHWGTSCWAAAIANVVNVSSSIKIRECKVIEKAGYRACSSSVECTDFGSRGFLIDKLDFGNVLIKYKSYSSIKKPLSHALSYTKIQAIINQNKPLIYAFDFDPESALSHVVNIVGYNTFYDTIIKIDRNHNRWLYIYDPKPNCVGTFYLKNYQTYQFPSPVGSIDDSFQDTYFGFSSKSRSTKSKVSGVCSTKNIYTPGLDSLKFVKQWFADFWNLISPRNKQIVAATGLNKNTMQGTELFLGTPLSIERVAARDSGVTPIQQIVVLKDDTEKIIPVIRCVGDDTIPKFVSAIVLRYELGGTKLVIDRIQALNIPESVVKEIKLGCPTLVSVPKASVAISNPTQIPEIKIGINFIETPEGFKYIRYGKGNEERVFDIYNQFQTPTQIIPIKDFRIKLGQYYLGESVSNVRVLEKPSSTSNELLDSNLQSFGLKDRDGRSIPVLDLRTQIRQSKNASKVSEIIFYQKN